MRVEIWADLVCPWCYIGKHRFEKALARFPHRAEVEVVLRSFQLDPGMPRAQARRQSDVLAEKYGMSVAQARARQAEVEKIAAADGLELHLQEGFTGNTFDAHRLVHLAKARGLGDAVSDRFYRAHFTEGRSLFDAESLIALAGEAGLDEEAARAVLASDEYAAAVGADLQAAASLGASGVPFYVLDRRYGISGAQRSELFERALAQAWQESRSEAGQAET
jgi:predicted DsbA family dithiol-disulfide isomerase